jgi:hypothetical protein
MATKESVIANLTKATYSAKEVLHLISTVTLDPIKPPFIIKGDCYFDRIGAKKRPFCVIKVVSDLAYAIPLTTTDNQMVLCEGKMPRFAPNYGLAKSYFARSVVAVPINVVQENYMFNYENNAAINKAIREMRKLMWQVLG